MIQVVTVTPKKLQVILSGGIYAEEAKKIRGSLIEYIDSGHQFVSIDLSEVDYIDGNGLGALIAIHTRAIAKKSHVEIKGLHGNIKELFLLAGLNKVLEVKED